jgi:hypothetical protein
MTFWVADPIPRAVLGRRPFATADEMDRYIESKLDDQKAAEGATT